MLFGSLKVLASLVKILNGSRAFGEADIELDASHGSTDIILDNRVSIMVNSMCN